MTLHAFFLLCICRRPAVLIFIFSTTGRWGRGAAPFSHWLRYNFRFLVSVFAASLLLLFSSIFFFFCCIFYRWDFCFVFVLPAVPQNVSAAIVVVVAGCLPQRWSWSLSVSPVAGSGFIDFFHSKVFFDRKPLKKYWTAKQTSYVFYYTNTI